MVVVSMNNRNFDELINDIKSKKTKEETQEYLMKNLSSEQNMKLKEILSDRKSIEKLLSTPKAQELLKKFTEGKND
jgi:ERCC4-type nuclease